MVNDRSPLADCEVHFLLSMHYAVYPDEFPVSVAPLALSRGLRHLFDAPH